MASLCLHAHLKGVVREEKADHKLLFVCLSKGGEGCLGIGKVAKNLPVVVEELLETIIGVLGAVLLPLSLGPDGLPGDLVGVDGGGLHGGQLHPFTGQVGA